MTSPRIFLAPLLLPLGLAAACATPHETLIRYRPLTDSQPQNTTLRINPQGCRLDADIPGLATGVSISLVSPADHPDHVYLINDERKIYAEVEGPASGRTDFKPLEDRTYAGTSCTRAEVLKDDAPGGEVCIANLPENRGCELLFFGSPSIVARMKAAGLSGVPLSIRLTDDVALAQEATAIESRPFTPSGKSLLEGYRELPINEFMGEVIAKPLQEKLQDAMEGALREMGEGIQKALTPEAPPPPPVKNGKGK